MLESVVARIVNNLLGKYVQELDTEGLNVGIFSGKVSLLNLKLKPSCLVSLKIQLKIHNLNSIVRTGTADRSGLWHYWGAEIRDPLECVKLQTDSFHPTGKLS